MVGALPVDNGCALSQIYPRDTTGLPDLGWATQCEERKADEKAVNLGNDMIAAFQRTLHGEK